MRGRPQVIRDGKLPCDFHNDWHPIEDFNVARYRNGGVPIYAPRCRVAEQTIRDRERNLDPARASMEYRAKAFASDLSKVLQVTISYHFVLDELLWRAKIPELRAKIGPGGCCDNCGTHHDDPAHYQPDHRLPVRGLTDWAAQHARNLGFLDGCNQKKGARPADFQYLDAQHRDWVAMRQWSIHAGSDGWPPWEPGFGTPPELIVTSGPVDDLGIPTLFWRNSVT